MRELAGWGAEPAPSRPAAIGEQPRRTCQQGRTSATGCATGGRRIASFASRTPQRPESRGQIVVQQRVRRFSLLGDARVSARPSAFLPPPRI